MGDPEVAQSTRGVLGGCGAGCPVRTCGLNLGAGGNLCAGRAGRFCFDPTA